jgi:LysM repeat protein
VPHPVRTIACGALALVALASCAANSSSGSTLAPMEVPSTTAFATLPPVTAPPTTLPGETTTIAPGAPIDYVVVAGDYLYGIAKAHGVSAEDIVTLNGWEDIHQALTPGETIKIPAPAAGGTATTVAPPTATAPTVTATTVAPTGGETTSTTVAGTGGAATTTSAPAVPEGGQQYTVKNGDTVYGIAKKFGITPQALVAANGWSDVNHALHPGDKIVVPAAA